MGNTWITDMRHYLDDAGHLPEDMPGPALGLAQFLGSIVEWVTSHPPGRFERTNVRCRRSPRRRRCLGDIYARFEESGGVIAWHCPFCADNGFTRGWEGSIWDRRQE
jgi:hypothetical protein